MGHLNFRKHLRLIILLFSIGIFSNANSVETITLDATDLWGDYSYSWQIVEGGIYNIQYTNRTFEAGVWNIVCFPFDVNESQLNETFNNDNYEIQQFDALNGKVFSFKKMEAPSLTAFTPYFLKTNTETISNPTFNNVVLKNKGNDTYSFGSESIFFKGSVYSQGSGLINVSGQTTFKLVNGALYKLQWDGGEGQKDIPAINGYFATTDGSTPSFTLENVSGGSGEGGDTPTPTTLAGKIAAREQITNVPTIYIDIPDVSDIDDDLTKDRGTGEALYHQASIQVVATTDKSSPNYLESFTDDHLQIKVRGNATADPKKRAYRLKFDKKDEITGQSYKHDLLGKGYSKRNWILKANAFDYSMVRDAVMTELGELVEMDFVPGYKYVDLVINNDYRGTYLVSDHAEVGSNRIPVDENTGWYVEFQGRDDMLDQPMCFSSPLQMNVKNPEPADETDEAQRNAVLQPIKDWFTNTWNYQIWGWDDSSFLNAAKDWREYNDEESWLKFILITELTADYDGYMTVKAYREADGKLCLGPIWDKDLAFGNITLAQDNSMVADIQNGSFRWYVHKLYLDKEFINHLRVLFNKLVDNGLQQTLNEKIDEISDNIKDTWAANFERWTFNAPDGSMQVFKEWTDQESYKNQLKEWIAERIAFLQTQYDTMSRAAGWMDITIDEPVVHQQLTDVPTIYINTNSTIDADVWETASIEVFDSNNMIGGNFTLDNTGLSIKYKGDGTAEKPSYRLKFTTKRALMGSKSGSYKQWELLANDDDPTMLRNALTKELGDQMGFAFTPGYQFADVYVNDKYMGTYQITDRVKVESGRVLAADKDTDWLVQIASVGEVDTRTDGNGDFYVEGNETSPYLIIKNPDKDDLTADQQSTLANEVGDYFNNTFWNDIENNVDQASFVNWYISSEILAAYKQLSNIYTYKSATERKLFFGPLSGNEKAYDNNSKYPMDMSDLDTDGSYNGMIFTRADYGVMRNKLLELWNEEWFKTAVLEKWNSIVSSNVKSTLKTKLTSLASEIEQTRAYNYKSADDGGAGWTLEGNFTDKVTEISTYLDNRFAYLDKKFNELANAEDIIMGDVNNDGVVDNADFIATLRHTIGSTPSVFNRDAADVNQDGEINNADAIMILRMTIN